MHSDTARWMVSAIAIAAWIVLCTEIKISFDERVNRKWDVAFYFAATTFWTAVATFTLVWIWIS